MDIKISGNILLVLIISSLLGLAIFSCTPNSIVQTRTELLADPRPLPEWLSATGPSPGESLLVSEAQFGEADPDDPFWPGYGEICIQLIGGTEIPSGPDLGQYVQLEINGRKITRMSGTWMRIGFIPKWGRIFISNADTPGNQNICWHMHLGAGKYLARIEVSTVKDDNLSYEWSFKLE